MDGDGPIEVRFGRAHPERYREPLDHFVSTSSEHMKANDAFFLSYAY